MTKPLYRIWWIPQVPMEPFRVPVPDPAEGKRLLSVLAGYDAFQFEHNVKPDYSNAGGLEWLDPDTGEWEDWYDPETGHDIDEWEPSDAEYLIWSNEHRAWWGPAESGYYVAIEHAGRYTRGEALLICRGANAFIKPGDNPNEIPVHEQDAMAYWGVRAQ